MTMLADVSFIALAFGLALSVFAYFFIRYMGTDDTVNHALTMREINTVKPTAQPAMAKAKAAGAA